LQVPLDRSSLSAVRHHSIGSSLLTKIAAVSLVLISPLAARAQAPLPSASDVLRHAAHFYRDLKSYQADIDVQSIAGPRAAQRDYVETGSDSAFRCEEKDSKGILRVSDGTNEWTLDRAAKQYTKAATQDSDSLIRSLAQIDQNVKDATLDGEETYGADATAKKVYIVEVARTAWPANAPANAQSVIYTIDEQTYEIYKAVTYRPESSEIAYYSFAQKPAQASGFAFTAPQGATQVDHLPAQAWEYKSIVGMQAPEFSLKDPTGQRSMKLSDYRGKVVVMAFVGTWCTACGAQLPYLQQVYDANTPADLEAFALDAGDNAKDASDYQANSVISFPMLVGAEPDVTKKYYVDDFPTTYVIGRDGKIVFRATQTENPGGFLAAIKAAVAKKN
jgi:peroxiredoxin/outer membrane lipoprotein-sorting protein